ncbi:biotin--[acetyl-CoA-carboxylase] ligase [Petrachloros mirabilis]
MRPSPPLNLSAIRSALSTQALGQRIELHDQLDSTNREAVALAQAGAEHGTLVLADSQTDGRGRLARRWYSPPGVNLYCSLIIRRTIDAHRLPEWLSWLPLIAALAATESIETVAAVDVAVKWPNDLLIGKLKTGGILCESGKALDTGPFQVIGIGLNVNWDPLNFPQELYGIATSISHDARQVIDRNILLGRLLNELEVCLDELTVHGSERIRLAYVHRCATIGKIVKAALTGGKGFVGLAETVERDGALKVVERPLPFDGRAPDIQVLRAGDVVHVRN